MRIVAHLGPLIIASYVVFIDGVSKQGKSDLA
jgi:hypothetical protein